MSSEQETGLSWVFVDKKHRERASELVDRFLGDEGVSDELGLRRWHLQVGGNLAPGVSTQQTRLRYFFFVPWAIYRARHDWDDEEESVESLVRSTRREVLADELVDLLENGADKSGIIGRESRRGLDRFPDETYWNGLRQWGVIESTDASPRRSEYFRAVPEDLENSMEESPVGLEPSNFWKEGVWRAVDEIEREYEDSSELSFSLSDREAEVIRARLEEPTPELEDTLVTYLLERAWDVRQGHVDRSDFERLLDSWDYPWEIDNLLDDEWVTADRVDCYEDLDDRVEAARGFAWAAQGAEIRYALECARRAVSPEKDCGHVSDRQCEILERAWEEWKESFENVPDGLPERPGAQVVENCLARQKSDDESTARFLDDFVSCLSREDKLADKIKKREHEAKSPAEWRLTDDEENLSEWNPPVEDDTPEPDDVIPRRDFRWGKLKDYARDLADLDDE